MGFRDEHDGASCRANPFRFSLGGKTSWLAKRFRLAIFLSWAGPASHLAAMNSERAVHKEEMVLLISGFLKEHRSLFPQTCEALEREAADILKPRRPSMKPLQKILVLF